jgi:rhodanese-related sulfurtransferase
MMFGFGRSRHREVSVRELKAELDAGTAQVIDVREPDEFAGGHIPGAINVPLSTFQPSRLPDAAGRRLVLNCLGGKRSAMALDKCAAAEGVIDTHLAGGFGAWAQAGLPVER